MNSQPRAAYLHVPFCRRRCGYCNFTLIAGRDDLIEAYLAAMELELAQLQSPRPVDTLFLGGGTPTHLPPPQLTQLLELARRWFPLANDYELSVEANPIDLTSDCTAALQQAGVNRISLGVQSFHDGKLALLERDHRRGEIMAAAEQCRAIARSWSLDLIFGAPGETLAGWRADLEAAISLSPDHLSTYGLTIEKGAAFFGRQLHGELAKAPEETEAQMYELAIDLLTAAGYEHYEVSNFARPSHRCRHNEAYWQGLEYYAAGPGAARYLHGRREMNHRSVTTYIQRVLAGHSPVAESEELGPEDHARERLVFALRRLEGLEIAAFTAATGFDPLQLIGAALPALQQAAALEITPTRLRLSRRGLLISDAVFGRIVRK